MKCNPQREWFLCYFFRAVPLLCHVMPKVGLRTYQHYHTKHLKGLMIVIVRMLWPVRYIIACFCHEVIHSASCLIDDDDCETVYGQ